MKKVLLFLTLTIFIFNSSISNTWASNFYCNKGQMQVQKSDVNNDMPCHEENNDKQANEQNHCDGLCACIHISINNLFDLKSSDYLLDLFLTSNKFDITNDNILSSNQNPLNRPPINS